MRRSPITTASTSALAACLALSLTGCFSSQSELLPTDKDKTMSSIWHGMTGQSNGGHESSTQPSRLKNARQQLRRPLQVKHSDDGDGDGAATRTAAYRPTAGGSRSTPRRRPAVDSRFKRLPNPTLQLYIYPHMDGGGEHVPVPGYTTVFPLYQRPHHARRRGAETSPRRQQPTTPPAGVRVQRAAIRTDGSSGQSTPTRASQ
ncbi:TIGR03751 family conjugal transfer lipoprotein [Salinisphaera orenii]|uniref:TIGR03751 family conjugal transfer lipoprotein n=1 Tax=Salinisphaera orenii TaxID=856731 RepID=UPI00296E5284